MKRWIQYFPCRRRGDESQTKSKLETPYVVSYRVLILLAALVFAGNLFATDVATDFSAANKLYAEGKFAEAASAYNAILNFGAQSPALLFNDANAEFKAGNLGRAIAAYRRAALLSPSPWTS